MKTPWRQHSPPEGLHETSGNRDDFNFLPTQTDQITGRFPHQRPGYRGNIRHRSRGRIGLVFTDNPELLRPSIIAAEGYQAAKGDDAIRRWGRHALGGADTLGEIPDIAQGAGGKPPSFIDVFNGVGGFAGFTRRVQLQFQRFQSGLGHQIGVWRNHPIGQNRLGCCFGTVFLCKGYAQSWHSNVVETPPGASLSSPVLPLLPLMEQDRNAQKPA